MEEIWGLFHHRWEPNRIFHMAEEPSERWLLELLNEIHAYYFEIITQTDELTVVMVRYPKKYQKIAKKYE